jgi:UDP-3-O-[3-hydroxymyristoyl] glucosamine N-acyltransferase
MKPWQLKKIAVIHPSKRQRTMRLSRPHSLEEIAKIVACKYIGDAAHRITGINEIHVVEPGDMVFVDHPKYYDKALGSAATTIIINKEVEVPEGKALLYSDDPFATFNALIQHFRPAQHWEKNEAQVHPTAHVAPGVVLGRNVRIGAHTVIHPNVVIYDDTEIGEHSIIHANTVIGGHAFYYKKRPEGFDKLQSCGGVYIGHRVEIGCACTIDKGVSGITHIGDGSKLDNQVHIGHDTVVGRDCLIAAQVGVAGCVLIEDGVTLWGQAGLRSDITIGKDAVVLAQTGVSKSLEGGKVYFGSPVGESRDKLKELANTRKIPGMLLDINSIKKTLDHEK